MGAATQSDYETVINKTLRDAPLDEIKLVGILLLSYEERSATIILVVPVESSMNVIITRAPK